MSITSRATAPRMANPGASAPRPVNPARQRTSAPVSSIDPVARLERAQRLGHRVDRLQRQVAIRLDASPGSACGGCGACAGCGASLPLDGSVRRMVQAKSLDDSGMKGLAETLAGDNSRSTVSVAKNSSDDYEIYAQSSLSSQSDTIDSYDNVTLKSDTNYGTGYHAEVIALMNNGSNLTKIAASQPVCKRCQAVLADNNVAAVNKGSQYTEHWQMPFNEEIDEDSAFPAKAKDQQRDGQSGSRWGMNSSNNLYSIAKSVWGGKHTNGW